MYAINAITTAHHHNNNNDNNSHTGVSGHLVSFDPFLPPFHPMPPPEFASMAAAAAAAAVDIKATFMEHYRDRSPYTSILDTDANTLLYDPPRHRTLTAARPLKLYVYGLMTHEWQRFGIMHAALSQHTDIARLLNGSPTESQHPFWAAEAPGKLDSYRRAMENHIILVPLSVPGDTCDDT